MDDAQHGHGVRRYWKGHYFRWLPDEAIDAFLLGGTLKDTARCCRRHRCRRTRRDRGCSGRRQRVRQRDAMFEFVAAARWSDPPRTSSGCQPPGAMPRRWSRSPLGMYVNAMSDEGAAGVARAYSPAKLRCGAKFRWGQLVG